MDFKIITRNSFFFSQNKACSAVASREMKETLGAGSALLMVSFLEGGIVLVVEGSGSLTLPLREGSSIAISKAGPVIWPLCLQLRVLGLEVVVRIEVFIIHLYRGLGSST